MKLKQACKQLRPGACTARREDLAPYSASGITRDMLTEVLGVWGLYQQYPILKFTFLDNKLYVGAEPEKLPMIDPWCAALRIMRPRCSRSPPRHAGLH